MVQKSLPEANRQRSVACGHSPFLRRYSPQDRAGPKMQPKATRKVRRTMFAELVEQPERAPQGDEQGPTILIIDDDDAMTDVLALRLQKQGFETITVATGERGLRRARSQQPAVIVLDLRLPDADGFDVCQQLADSPETCAIPVIILSGMEEPDILRRCRAAGCQFFLRKPYDPNVLLTLIRQSIDDAAHWDELP